MSISLDPHDDLPRIVALEIAQPLEEELRHPPKPIGGFRFRLPGEANAHVPRAVRVPLIEETPLSEQVGGSAQERGDGRARDIASRRPSGVPGCPKAAEQPIRRKVDPDGYHGEISRGRRCPLP
jgi:hypothetical protein